MSERGASEGLIIGGVALGLGATFAALLASRPAQAAPSEEKFDYLIDLLTALIPALADWAEGQATLNLTLQQWLAAQGIEPGAKLSISTQWSSGDKVEMYRDSPRSVGTFDASRMVRWTEGKRILFKIESSLDQAVNIQLVGNLDEDMALASNINGVLACAANGNISIGPAWDDWHPFLGIRIIVAVAPVTGILTIRAVIQE